MSYHLMNESRDSSETLSMAKTILVVDDYPSLCDLAATMLRNAGYRVLTAPDGETALNLVAKNLDREIDLLVSDYEMPRMRGDELARELIHSHPATKVLLMSSTVPRPAEPLVYSFLPKPFSSNSLLAMVRATLARSETK